MDFIFDLTISFLSIKLYLSVITLDVTEGFYNDRIRYGNEKYDLQFVLTSETWPTPHWQVNTPAERGGLGLFGIVRDCLGLFGIVRDCSGLFGIVRDCSGLFRTVPDCSGQ